MTTSLRWWPSPRRPDAFGARPPGRRQAPRKPTVEEARQAALEELVPAAIKSLPAHFGDGDPTAWRAALRVFEHAFGRAPEQTEEAVLPIDPDGVASLTWQ